MAYKLQLRLEGTKEIPFFFYLASFHIFNILKWEGKGRQVVGLFWGVVWHLLPFGKAKCRKKKINKIVMMNNDGQKEKKKIPI